MGRIKTQLIKRITLTLVKRYKDQFSKDFKKNKAVVEQLMEHYGSKKMRNTIAGYITRIMRKGDRFFLKNI